MSRDCNFRDGVLGVVLNNTLIGTISINTINIIEYNLAHIILF